MKTTYFTVGIGMGDKFDTIRAFIAGLGGGGTSIESLGPISMKFAALMIMLYIVLVKVAVGSIIVAFAGSASTIAYLVLRKDVDGTEMFDVYIEEDDVVPETKENNIDAETPGAKKEKTAEVKAPEKPKPEPKVDEKKPSDESSGGNGSSPGKPE